MATAAVATPSYARAEPGSYPLRLAQYPESTAPPKADVQKIATEWVDTLNKALSSPDYDALNQLFLKDSCWRDQLGLSWNYHTFSGPENIISFLKSSPHGSRIKKISIDDSSDLHRPNVTAADFNGKVTGVGSFLTIETDVGRGPGIVRLMQDKDGKWKAFTLFTAIHELQGHKEMTSGNRPNGVIHGSNPGRKNWQERRTAMENFEGDNEPTVLILGDMMLISLLGWEWKLTCCILFRCWTRWPHICSSTTEPRYSDLNHRPQPSSWRQLAQ
jgi:hypothetical protein